MMHNNSLHDYQRKNLLSFISDAITNKEIEWAYHLYTVFYVLFPDYSHIALSYFKETMQTYDIEDRNIENKLINFTLNKMHMTQNHERLYEVLFTQYIGLLKKRLNYQINDNADQDPIEKLIKQSFQRVSSETSLTMDELIEHIHDTSGVYFRPSSIENLISTFENKMGYKLVEKNNETHPPHYRLKS